MALGFTCWGFAAGAPVGMLGLLAAVGLAAFASIRAASRRAVRNHGPAWGVAGAVALGGLSWALQRWSFASWPPRDRAPLDLVGHFFEGGVVSVHRAILFLAATAWLALLVRGAAATDAPLAGNRRPEDRSGADGCGSPLWR